MAANASALTFVLELQRQSQSAAIRCHPNSLNPLLPSTRWASSKALLETPSSFACLLPQTNYMVNNSAPVPEGNPNPAEVMKITIDPAMSVKLASAADASKPVTGTAAQIPSTLKLSTRLNPSQRLATIPPLATLYEAQTKKVEKHVMLMERFAGGCSQGLAVSECKNATGAPVPPDGSSINSIWAVPSNCLTSTGMPRNMFSDGAPLTCKEGECANLQQQQQPRCRACSLK
jgi:hypothetical protein